MSALLRRIGAGRVMHTNGVRLCTALPSAARASTAALRAGEARCDRLPDASATAAGASGRPSCPQLFVGGHAGAIDMHLVRGLSPFALRAYSTNDDNGSGAPPQHGACPWRRIPCA
jgi:hypothetical protein